MGRLCSAPAIRLHDEKRRGHEVARPCSIVACAAIGVLNPNKAGDPGMVRYAVVVEKDVNRPKITLS